MLLPSALFAPTSFVRPSVRRNKRSKDTERNRRAFGLCLPAYRGFLPIVERAWQARSAKEEENGRIGWVGGLFLPLFFADRRKNRNKTICVHTWYTNERMNVPVVDLFLVVYPESGQLGQDVYDLERLEIIDEYVGHPQIVNQLEINCNGERERRLLLFEQVLCMHECVRARWYSTVYSIWKTVSWPDRQIVAFSAWKDK